MIANALRAIPVALMVVSSTWTGVAAADQGADADRLYEVGLRQAKAGQHLEAGAAFLEAFALDPNPSLLWNAARSFAAGGDTDRARTLFERYANHTDAKPAKVEQARAWLDANKSTAPASVPLQEPSPEAPPEEPPSEPPSTDTGSILGWTLCGAGIAGLVGGSLAVILAAQSRDETYKLTWNEDHRDTLKRHEALTQETQLREALGWITLGMASALIGTGLAVLLSGSDEVTVSAGAPPRFSLTPLPGGLSAASSWRF